jgi:predicted ATP-binding protein involved in virulence
MKDLRITRLVLNNVGVFEHLDLNFKKQGLKDKAEIHIFTGDNGTGKTTLLEALTHFDVRFNDSLKAQRGELHKTDNLYQKMLRLPEEARKKSGVSVYFQKDVMKMPFFGKAHFTNKDYFEDYYDPDTLYTAQTYTFFAYNGHRKLEYSKTEALKRIEFNPITEALTFNKTSLNTSLFQWISNNKTRAALSYQKGNKQESENYLMSIQKIETAIGDIIGRKIEFVIDERLLNVMVKLDKDSFPYDTLADGYKSVISWIVDLFFRLDLMPKEGRENFTLFLDEIDVHLHPAAQRRILPVIQKLFPKAQIFLTTHSPFVIGSIDDAWVYKFKLNENGKSVLDGEPFLTEDGKSYRHILEEVFDIDKHFGEAVEKKLEEFYKTRDAILKSKNGTSASLKQLTKTSQELAEQSAELRAIVGSELRQLSRIINKEIAI